MSTLIEAFLLLIVVIDPLASILAFMALTKNMKPAQKRRVALKSSLVALLVILLFAFGGDLALRALGVQLDTFKAAGGIILTILGIQMALGLNLPKEDDKDVSDIAVVIGTPMIAGPATITTTMILTKDVGLPFTVGAGIVVILITFGLLLLSERITRAVGRGSIRVLATMMGIITIAWGLQFILSGVAGFLGA
jgi:multiple antibiotic resistance protein